MMPDSIEAAPAAWEGPAPAGPPGWYLYVITRSAMSPPELLPHSHDNSL